MPWPLSRRFTNLPPTRMIFLAFSTTLCVGAAALMVPFATRPGTGAPFMVALFTSVSSLCVTGLVTVDTETYWAPLGQAIILTLIQIGGFGVMTLATVIGYGVLGKISLRTRITAATEVKTEGLDNIKQLVLAVVRISLTVEGLVALVLTCRFWLGYGMPVLEALWLGCFHAISSFNNAGFALFSDSLMGFVSDPWICLPIAGAIIIGGTGFPVIMQLRKHFRNRLKWSMNTRLVLVGTAFLLLAGTIYITAIEWANPATLGSLDWPEKLLAGFFQSVQTRTAGFNSVDIAQMHDATWIGIDVLMFIGGGPAGTAGGIKITTFLVLWFIIWTELRGETAFNIFGKRLSRGVHRQAISVALLAVALVVVAATLLVLLSGHRLDQCLFEAISAFATVGLSTGITSTLNTGGQLILCFLMFVGRLGPITFASALALQHRKRLYELPKERPIIG